MRKASSNLPRVSLLATLVASSVSLGFVASASAQQNVSIDRFQQATGFVKSEDRSEQQQFPNYYIVELEDASIAMQLGTTESGQAPGDVQRLKLESDEVQTYASHLAAQQDQVSNALTSQVAGLTVTRNLSIIMNALIVEHNGDQDIKRQLMRTPGVKRVHEHEMFYAQMDVSNELINSPEVWQLIGSQDRAGEGVKVAVIDGGINSGHEMFASNGHQRPSGLPNDDYCSVFDESFCNDKLALARYYTPTFEVHPDEHISPEDFGGHGTHVAGTAVGNPVSITYNGVDTSFSGVAPGATLMAYKALFNNPAGQGSGSNIMLVQALEDAVADGADVINNSWGGGPGNPQTSPYYPMFQAAEAAGVVVVTAAGNSGPGAGTVGCPSCIEEGLAVASTQHGRSFGHVVEAAGLPAVEAFLGNGDFSIDEPIEGPLMPAMEIDADNALACEPFEAGSFDGHIAMVQRGTCAFEDKANNFADAGAIGMVLWNNEPGIIIMTLGDATLPSVSISEAAGEAVIEALEEGAEAYASISEPLRLMNPNAIDIMSGFSSRGPNFDSSFLKPDIAAPGSDILSAIAGDNDAYSATYSGTSMASPNVAGAAALIRQLRPELDAKQIKSILMTSSNRNILKEDGETPADWFDIGAGRLDVPAAVASAVALDTASIASSACVVTCTFERTITNLLDEEGEWHGSVSFQSSSVYGELSTDTVTLSANDSATFRLTVDTRFADPGWEFGEVVWTDASGEFPDVRIPVAVAAAMADNRQVLDTMVVSGEVTAGEPFTVRSIARDGGFPSAVSLVTRIPEALELNEDSVTYDSEFATTTGSSIAANGRSISWAGNIGSGTPSSSLDNFAFPFAGQSVTELTDDYAEICGVDQACDEVSIGVEVGMFGGFIWDDQLVDYVSFSENGFLAIGDQNVAGYFNPQRLPSTMQPNGTIAPLWTDFEIGAQFGGAMYYNIVADGNGDPWFVWEWNDVAEFANLTGNRYTFAVWMKLGSDEVVFNYIDVPGQAAFGQSVGIENVSGNVGTSRYFNGTGSFPTTGESLLAEVNSNRGYAAIEYQATAEHFGSTSGASIHTMQDESVNYDLAEYISPATSDIYSHTTLVTAEGNLDAITPIFVTASGDASITIVDEPENGSVSIEGTEVTYTPEDGFFGSDSFTYQLVDDAGNTSATSTVQVEVERENVPPIAVASAPSAVNSGESVTLSGSGSTDPNEDELSFSWVQTDGPSVTLSGADSESASFTAPAQNATLTFELTVSDGEFTDTDTVSVDVNHSSSRSWYEGSFGALIALIGLPLIWVRRRRNARA